MIIGTPKEIKDNEYRVGLVPAGVKQFIRHGHKVLIQNNAGIGSGVDDEEYKAVGAEIIESAEQIFKQADMIIKVKEPINKERDYLRPDQILYTYLHLAPDPEQTKALLEHEVIGIAYETIQEEDGSLPLLIPMSEVAGRMAVQVGATYIQKINGGKGILLGGVPGVPPAEVVIIGAGSVGINSAKMAFGLGARVSTVVAGGLKTLVFPGFIRLLEKKDTSYQRTFEIDEKGFSDCRCVRRPRRMYRDYQSYYS